MPQLGKFLAILFLAMACGTFLLALGLATIGNGWWPGLMPLLFLMLAYGWMVFAFVHYRVGRQDEFLQLLIAAVEADAPLAPAVRAYLEDRPQGPQREFWVSTLLFFVFPGYYWLWHREHCFDRKVLQLAWLLEEGVPLYEALDHTPGIASREAILGAVIGESTGRLALCLRNASRRRLAPLWLEILPRFLYPLIVFMFLTAVATFWMISIGPRIQRIYADFHVELPALTGTIIAGWNFGKTYFWIPMPFVAAALALMTLLFGSSSARWYFPGVARIYRMEMRSRVLQMLGVVLEAGRPVPQALGLLSDSGYFRGTVRRRLARARLDVERGESLTVSMRRRGLLTAAFVPLLEAAQRAQTLPWALTELGEMLAGRAVRLMRRTSQVLAPLVLVTIGIITGCLVIGMFLPLVKLIWSLNS